MVFAATAGEVRPELEPNLRYEKQVGKAAEFEAAYRTLVESIPFSPFLKSSGVQCTLVVCVLVSPTVELAPGGGRVPLPPGLCRELRRRPTPQRRSSQILFSQSSDRSYCSVSAEMFSGPLYWWRKWPQNWWKSWLLRCAVCKEEHKSVLAFSASRSVFCTATSDDHLDRDDSIWWRGNRRCTKTRVRHRSLVRNAGTRSALQPYLPLHKVQRGNRYQ